MGHDHEWYQLPGPIAAWAVEIERVYNGDLEKVDLKSDRFLSKDYTAEVYTEPGLEWVEGTTMIDVLERHFPAVSPALKGVGNAFHPWTAVG